MNEIYQDIFDRACKAVIAQGEQSIMGSDFSITCAYRGRNGMKCAIGHLLSDDQIVKYKVKEGTAPNQFPPQLILDLAPGIDSVDELDNFVKFLVKLQDAHDNCRGIGFVNEFIVRANDLAKEYRLNPLSE